MAWFLPLILFLAGCTDVTEIGDTTVLRYSLTTIATVGVLGVGFVIFGAFILIRVLPKRWKSAEIRLQKRLRSAVSLSVPFVIGVILLILVVPFAWYRVEVSPTELRISEFPNEARFRGNDIRKAGIQPGNGGKKRIFLQMEDGREFFINESEIGAEGFERIRLALEGFLRRKIQ